MHCSELVDFSLAYFVQRVEKSLKHLARARAQVESLEIYGSKGLKNPKVRKAKNLKGSKSLKNM